MNVSHDFPWAPWDEATFARARAEGKPILLHIGATWCHWCHVMDEDTYTHVGVTTLIRDHFIAIRVDTDLRPDINERYNQGGWPTLAVLDGEGEVLLGRTYVPGPELVHLLRGYTHGQSRWSVTPERPRPPAARPVAIGAISEAVADAYDRRYGGFGEVEKFPHIGILEWLLDRAARTAGADAGRGPARDMPAREMLSRTLDAMAGWDLYDHEEGGFFRYATQDDWGSPHTEKLLDDNARLLAVYTRAWALEPRPLWRQAAEAALAWAIRVLWDDAADGFAASQDADSGYYALPRARRGTAPSVDPTIQAGWNGWMIVALCRAAAAFDRPGLLGLARRLGLRLRRDRLEGDGRVVRAGPVAGLLEDQVALAEGWMTLGAATGDATWFDAAAGSLTWARDHLGAPGGGCYDRVPGGFGRLRHGQRPLPANAALAVATHRLAAYTGDAAWADFARATATAALTEAEGWGHMAAPAAAAWERVTAEPVVVKVHAAPALMSRWTAQPQPDILALAVSGATAQRLGLAPGQALACTRRACARPAVDDAGVVAAIRALTATR